MEFRYFALSDLMTGWNQYDWSHIEDTLKETGRRGNQLVMRVYSEYPGRKLSLPQFLIDEGVRVVQWQSPNGRCFTPDYNNKTLQRAMQEFIAAFGKNAGHVGRMAQLPQQRPLSSQSNSANRHECICGSFQKNAHSIALSSG